MENQRNSLGRHCCRRRSVGLTAALLLAEAKVKVAVEKPEKPGDLPRAIMQDDRRSWIARDCGTESESLCDTGSPLWT